MKINHLTVAEENLMKLFWELDTFYLKDIMEKHPEPKPHQNTVSTYLKILIEKGYLTTQKQGRIFKYSVQIPKSEYKKFIILDLYHNLFNQSAQEIYEILVDQNLLNLPTKVVKTPKSTMIMEAEKAPEMSPSHELVNEILKKKKKNKGKVKDKSKKKKNKDKD